MSPQACINLHRTNHRNTGLTFYTVFVFGREPATMSERWLLRYFHRVGVEPNSLKSPAGMQLVSCRLAGHINARNAALWVSVAMQSMHCVNMPCGHSGENLTVDLACVFQYHLACVMPHQLAAPCAQRRSRPCRNPPSHPRNEDAVYFPPCPKSYCLADPCCQATPLWFTAQLAFNTSLAYTSVTSNTILR